MTDLSRALMMNSVNCVTVVYNAIRLALRPGRNVFAPELFPPAPQHKLMFRWNVDAAAIKFATVTTTDGYPATAVRVRNDNASLNRDSFSNMNRTLAFRLHKAWGNNVADR